MCTAEQNETPGNFTSDTINLLSAHCLGLRKKEAKLGKQMCDALSLLHGQMPCIRHRTLQEQSPGLGGIWQTGVGAVSDDIMGQ